MGGGGWDEVVGVGDVVHEQKSVFPLHLYARSRMSPHEDSHGARAYRGFSIQGKTCQLFVTHAHLSYLCDND